jgi:hypothetical protein
MKIINILEFISYIYNKLMMEKLFFTRGKHILIKEMSLGRGPLGFVSLGVTMGLAYYCNKQGYISIGPELAAQA